MEKYFSKDDTKSHQSTNLKTSYSLEKKENLIFKLRIEFRNVNIDNFIII